MTRPTSRPARHQWETMGTPGGGSFVYPVPQWPKEERPYVPTSTEDRDPLWVWVLVNVLLVSTVVTGLTVQFRWLQRQVRKALGR